MALNKITYNLANLARKVGININGENNVRVLAMKKEIAKLDDRIEFKVEHYPDGSWTAESTNIDGIITGGKTNKNMSAEIKDAVFTYFAIPPQFCVDSLLRADNEPVTVTQRVYV